ncbi:acylphosphatase [Desulfohalobium retbaense]|uniref:acylphosphatase n=1 Tax=Desulfohalobium retbaense (strain ATCC 49708 / DSM 5692 / JCM 16813 / HR100) TaxID=485915 RepID=C8X2C4_DESRD|nr:acylphosphatase [Desulfohalobium retbaense]ACV68571.1 acylphosphatase [Desulfohalobium retbaense DSM 5692]
MPQSLHCVLSGKVQMVGFRTWAQDHARSLGLGGWVRNLHDGRVEILAQGEMEQLENFRNRILQGPSLGRVDKVECDWIDYDKSFDKFELRR